MLRFCLSIIVVMLIWAPFVAQAADRESAYDRVMRTGVIKCGYFIWPPYLKKDLNTGKMEGINYEIMEEIGKTLGLKIDWAEETAPGTAIEGLNTGRYDVVCTTLWPDAARLKNAFLTSPTMYSAAYAVVRSDDDRFDHGKKDINSPDVTLPGIDGDYTYSLAVNNYPKAKLLSLPQDSDGGMLLMSLVTKKADVVFIDKGTMNGFNKTSKNVLRLVKGVGPIKIFSEALAVQKSEGQLGNLLNQAIDILNDDAVVERIISKYPDNGYYAPQKRWKSE